MCCPQAQFSAHKLVQTSWKRVPAGDGEGGGDRLDTFCKVHRKRKRLEQAAGPSGRKHAAQGETEAHLDCNIFICCNWKCAATHFMHI